MCSGFEASSYSRLIDIVLSLNSRLEGNKEEDEGSAEQPHFSVSDFESPASGLGLRVER